MCAFIRVCLLSPDISERGDGVGGSVTPRLTPERPRLRGVCGRARSAHAPWACTTYYRGFGP